MSKRIMQAMRVHQYGGPEQLTLEQIPRPVAQAGEVLIRVYAAGVLPAEWKQRQGDDEHHPGEGVLCRYSTSMSIVSLLTPHDAVTLIV